MTERARTLIIAEAGVNHNGSIELAQQLIDAAAEAGVDYVKFQTFKTEKLVSRSAAKAEYQKVNTGDAAESQFAMIKRLELDAVTHRRLIDHCEVKSVKFFSTAFDLDSIDLLEELGLDRYKVPSGEITNLPYLQKIAALGKPVILSTGMSTLADVEAAIAVMTRAGLDRRHLTLLHCNTDYPTPMGDVNLRAMNTLATAFGVPVGYSDHTLGIEVPIAAVARGAVCIEKHFTLDRELPGPDHRASLEPAELKAMVTAIRNVELALGSPLKQPSPSEAKNLTVARKSVFVARDLSAGDLLTEADLTTLRPGDGISPMRPPGITGAKGESPTKHRHHADLRTARLTGCGLCSSQRPGRTTGSTPRYYAHCTRTRRSTWGLVVGGTHLSAAHGHTVTAIEQDGYPDSSSGTDRAR